MAIVESTVMIYGANMHSELGRWLYLRFIIISGKNNEYILAPEYKGQADMSNGLPAAISKTQLQ
eukprot:scaffold307051_cov17-Prasinocladus_malaysianus.AAC.1